MEQVVIALIVVALIGCLIFSRWSPPLLFSAAMAACVMVGSIDLSSVMEKATNEGLVTLLLLLMVWLVQQHHRHLYLIAPIQELLEEQFQLQPLLQRD